MKNSLLLLFLVLSSFAVFSQTTEKVVVVPVKLVSDDVTTSPWIEKAAIDQRKSSLTVGFNQGGGSLLGADFEYLLGDKVGIQAGMGLASYGFGVNVHFRPGLRSSFLHLGYRHIGVGPNYVLSTFGPSFVYRAKKLFSCQLGYGFVMERGPAIGDYATASALIHFAIGLYFPI